MLLLSPKSDALASDAGAGGAGGPSPPTSSRIPAEDGFRYAVMTNDVIPGSRNKSYGEQLTLLPEGYEMPEVLDAATAILWGMRRSETLGFRDSPWTYTCCKKIIGVLNNLIVGGYVSSGLDVASVSSIASVSYKSEHTGVAGWRKF